MNKLLSLLFLTFFSPSLFAQERTIGVVTLDQYEKGDSLVFYNDDETAWLKFDPYYREDESSFSMPSNFQPLAFHPDNFLLVLRAQEIVNGFATVIIDESQNGYSVVNLASKTLKYVEWADFMSSVYAVGLSKENEIYEKPESESKIDYVQIEHIEFKPIKVSNDWLQINWTHEDKTHSGWVKWRDKEDNLLVDFFYFS